MQETRRASKRSFGLYRHSSVPPLSTHPESWHVWNVASCLDSFINFTPNLAQKLSIFLTLRSREFSLRSTRLDPSWDSTAMISCADGMRRQCKDYEVDEHKDDGSAGLWTCIFSHFDLTTLETWISYANKVFVSYSVAAFSSLCISSSLKDEFGYIAVIQVPKPDCLSQLVMIKDWVYYWTVDKSKLTVA